MEAEAQEIAGRLRSAERAALYCHLDADGITGGAIASEALSRLGIEHEISFLRKLDEAALQVIRREEPPLAWFIDFGAGQLHHMEGLDAEITDLAAIAVVGAVADVQDREHRRLLGYNRKIVQDGIDAGVLQASTDLRLFGRETRPIHKMLEYSQDPWIPRLTKNGEAAIAFLLEIGIDLKVDETWRTWAELDPGEKRRIVSELVTHMLTRGCGWRAA